MTAALRSLKVIFPALLAAFSIAVTNCAAPAPTATPTQPSVAAPTPTKAPTAIPTTRPLVKTTLAMSSEVVDHLAILLAESQGYFREEGLDMDRVVIGGGGKAVAAVVGGSAQFVSTTPTEPLNAAVAGGKPLVIVAANTGQLASPIIMRKDVADRLGITAKSPVQDRLKALKGLKISISSPGSVTDSTTRFALKAAGLDPERDVEISALGTTEAQLAALKSGQSDVMVRASPTTDIPVAEGWGITLIDPAAGDISELSGILNIVTVMAKDYAETTPEIALPAVRAVTKALKFIHSDPAKVKDATRKIYQDLDVKVFDTMWNNLYPRLWVKDPVPTRDGIQKHIDFVAAFNPDAKRVTPEQINYPRYAEQAKRELADWRP